MRLMLLCVSAATLPTVMVRIARTYEHLRHSVVIAGSPSMRIRSSIANDAAFDPTDRNAVIGVGAPSYTSGAHMWNGTAAILNAMPATSSTARVSAGFRHRRAPPRWSRSLVVPAIP